MDLLEKANNIVLRMDTEGNITFVNDFAEGFFLFGKDELLGKNVVGTIVPVTDRAGKRLAAMIRSIGRNPDRYVRNENENVRRTGERVWVLWTNKPVRDEEGRTVEILCVGSDITERKRMEEVLLEARNELKQRVKERTAELALKNRELRVEITGRRRAEEVRSSILRAIPHAVLGLKEGTVIFANDAVEAVFGWKPEDLIGRGTRVLFRSNEEYEETGNHFYHELEKRKTLSEEHRFRHKDGRDLLLRASGARIGTSLKDKGVVITYEDITLRRRNEERMEKLDRALYAVKNITESLLKVETEKELLRSACDLLAEVGFIRFVWAGSARQGSPYVLPVAWAGVEDGYLSSVKIAWDSSEYGKGPTGTSVKTAKPSIVQDIETDPMFAPWRDEALKRGYHSVMSFPLMHEEEVFSYLTAYSGVKHAFQEEEVAFLTQVAGDIAIGVKSLRLKEELALKHEELTKAYAELKASEVRIVKQEKMALLGQMAAGVAHEINNPTGFVKSNLDTLRGRLGRIRDFVDAQSQAIEELDDAPSGNGVRARVEEARRHMNIDRILEDSEDLLGECVEGMARVEHIVQDLKGFSRNDGRHTAADLNACIDGALRIVWNQMKYKVTVNKQYAVIPSIVCDPGQLSQVFMNILMNAAQTMEQGGEITIRTWQDGGFAWASVRDEGPGIPEESLKRIFEPFFTTKAAGTGTGLGLSIVLDIIGKHGGDVSAENNAGGGSTFTVRIPLPDNTEEDLS